LLPLTSEATIEGFIESVGKSEFILVPYFLSSKLLSSYNYFLQYMIQLMFLSVGFWLIDAPHMVAFWAKKTCCTKKNRKPVDTFMFELGYHLSYTLTIMQIGLMYSLIVPIVPAFCVPFFGFKYYVDKYNLSFVYESEFLGLGKIYNRIVPFAYFNILMY
jgi:hypothetical protein